MNGRVPTVWLVDDDPSIRKSLRRLLLSYGYHAVAFASPEDALQNTDSSDVDCLILDVRMPGMSGLDLYRKLVSRGLDSPVIFITGYEDPLAARQAESMGAVALLRKPFEDTALLALLRTALGGPAEPNT